MLGRVDRIAAEHGVDPVPQARFLGQLQQELQRLVRDPMLRVVKEQSGGLGREPLAASGVGGEQLPEVPVAHRLRMSLECLPGRQVTQWCCVHLRVS